MTITEITERIKEIEDFINSSDRSEELAMELEHELEVFNELLKCKIVVKYFEDHGTASDKDVVKNLSRSVV